MFTDRRHADAVRADGAEFRDLFESGLLEEIEDDSYPPPSNYVTWTARHADAVIDAVRRVGADVVIADSFAVIARVVAEALGLPYVSVRAGHNVLPETMLSELEDNPRVRISDQCRLAARRLRDEYGLSDASPFAFLSPPSRDLNIYCEPRQFLTEAERAAFEPVAFFGCLSPPAAQVPSFESPFPETARLRVYLSFGSYHGRFFPEVVASAMRSVAGAIAVSPGSAGLFSFGGITPDPSLIADLSRQGVQLARTVNQWQVLTTADAFVTHHGMNSTHEAVFREVPMLSYPLLWDQPGLARRCQELDLAIGLVDEPQGSLDVESVRTGLERVRSERERLAAGLAAAHGWEEEVIAGRAGVIDRVAELARA